MVIGAPRDADPWVFPNEQPAAERAMRRTGRLRQPTSTDEHAGVRDAIER